MPTTLPSLDYLTDYTDFKEKKTLLSEISGSSALEITEKVYTCYL